MAGVVVDSRIKTGTLTLTVDSETISVACQARNITLVPPDQPSGDEDQAVLCGATLPPEGGDAGASWRMQINTIQDFTSPAGVQRFLIAHRGQLASVSWLLDSGFGASGELTIWPGNLGGDVKARLESQLEMRFTTEPVWSWPAPPAAWEASTAYSVGDRVTLSGGEILQATVAGTSDATEPVAPTIGGTVTDGSVTWSRVS